MSKVYRANMELPAHIAGSLPEVNRTVTKKVMAVLEIYDYIVDSSMDTLRKRFSASDVRHVIKTLDGYKAPYDIKWWISEGWTEETLPNKLVVRLAGLHPFDRSVLIVWCIAVHSIKNRGKRAAAIADEFSDEQENSNGDQSSTKEDRGESTSRES